MRDQAQIIQAVYEDLQSRTVNPSGTFDRSGRFYAANADLISVRAPSRAYPYSHMLACRTKKYVAKVCKKFGCVTKEDLLRHI